MFKKINALWYRSCVATFSDKGRVADMLLFSMSYLVIWGLFLYADIVDKNVATSLFLINLIWAITGTIQTQSNRGMMNDIW
ncbi:MAG: hypothetical protein ACOX3T_06940 [Bdellovibrionota bacterium]